MATTKKSDTTKSKSVGVKKPTAKKSTAQKPTTKKTATAKKSPAEKTVTAAKKASPITTAAPIETPKPKIRLLSPATKSFLLKAQKNEETEHLIYKNIAKMVKNQKKKDVLEKCYQEEKKHAGIWKSITEEDIKPNGCKVFWYTLLAKLLGYTFTLKLMEGGEHNASPAYEKIAGEVPEAKAIAADEVKHEAALLDMLDEERLQYVGSMVLGLSAALVELTGTLAGLTFAMGNLRLVALSGLITGIAATLSMTSSAYLSEKADNNPHALKSSLYTGGVYILTVVVLILPYLLLPSTATVAAVLILAAIVVLLIAAFMFYVAVARSENFWKKFGEMAIISISVAVLSFAIGLVVKQCLHIDV